MPATVSIFNSGGFFSAEGTGNDDADNATDSTVESGDSVGGISGSSRGDGGGGGLGGVAGREKALVVLTLGPPEVDSGTGNTVFSLSAEEQVGYEKGGRGGGGREKGREGGAGVCQRGQGRGEASILWALVTFLCRRGRLRAEAQVGWETKSKE